MDLRRIVRGPIGAVNPDVPVGWLKYLAATAPDNSGKSSPTYAPLQTPMGQVQPLSTGQLMHMDQLNIQGVLRSVYLKGAVATAVREDGTGGDLLQFPEVPGGPQHTWLVVEAPEQWPDWCRVIARLQLSQ
jgi:hypothetical protein